jgi:NAD-dependent SIR2 family protein deacetylase
MSETAAYAAQRVDATYTEQVNLDYTGAFCLPLSNEAMDVGNTASLGVAVRSERVSALSLMISEQLADDLPPAHNDLQVTHDVAGDAYYTHKDTPPSALKGMRKIRQMQIGQLAAVRYPGSGDQAQPITVAETAALMADHDPRTILFLTGAGLSVDRVWTHHQLAERCGFTIGRGDSQRAAINQQFLRDFVTEPKTAQTVVRAHQELLFQKRHAETTAGHKGFADIMFRLYDEPLAATTNFDLLHGKSGLWLPRIARHWPEVIESPQDAEAAFGHELARRAQAIGLIVTIGVASDSKGLIEYVRSQNSQATTLAVNAEAPENLAYMHKGDRHLRHDAQQALPHIAAVLGA